MNFPCSFVFLVVASAVTGQLVYYIFFGYNFGGNVGFFPQFSMSSLHLPAALNPIANSLKKDFIGILCVYCPKTCPSVLRGLPLDEALA